MALRPRLVKMGHPLAVQIPGSGAENGAGSTRCWKPADRLSCCSRKKPRSEVKEHGWADAHRNWEPTRLFFVPWTFILSWAPCWNCLMCIQPVMLKSSLQSPNSITKQSREG